MKLQHSPNGKQMPKTAREAHMMFPNARKAFNTLSPAAKEVALKLTQRKLDQVKNVFDVPFPKSLD